MSLFLKFCCLGRKLNLFYCKEFYALKKNVTSKSAQKEKSKQLNAQKFENNENQVKSRNINNFPESKFSSIPETDADGINEIPEIPITFYTGSAITKCHIKNPQFLANFSKTWLK